MVEKIPVKKRGRGRPKKVSSSEISDQMKAVKTAVEALVKLNKLMPRELMEKCLMEVSTKFIMSLEELKGKLIRELNPKDKYEFAAMLDKWFIASRDDIASVKINVEDLVENMDLVADLSLALGKKQSEN